MKMNNLQESQLIITDMSEKDPTIKFYEVILRIIPKKGDKRVLRSLISHSSFQEHGLSKLIQHYLNWFETKTNEINLEKQIEKINE